MSGPSKKKRKTNSVEVGPDDVPFTPDPDSVKSYRHDLNPSSVEFRPDPDTVMAVPHDPSVVWFRYAKNMVPVTPRKRAHFLKVLGLCGNPKRAAIASGIPISAVNRLRKQDVTFDLACSEAENDAVDMAEFELYRRAVEGEDEQLTFNGIPTGYTVKKRSDRLLMFLLQAKRPEYRAKMELNANLTTKKSTDELSDTELESIIRTRFPKKGASDT